MKIIRRYPGRHASVFLVEGENALYISKRFTSAEAAARESGIYKSLAGKALPAAELISSGERELSISYIPGTDYEALLSTQEKNACTDMEAWFSLAQTVTQLHRETGLAASDANLRNYIYGDDGRAYAIDLEGYAPGAAERTAGALCAFIPLYSPENSPFKLMLAERMKQIFVQSFGMDAKVLENEALRQRELILGRRAKHRGSLSRCTAVILAGGKSSRMGRDKAGLPIGELSFVQYQVRRLRRMGIDEIFISGGAAAEGADCIPDELPDRGPLGGIYTCMKAASNPQCLVVSVDAPFVPETALAALADTHRSGDRPVTLLSQAGELQMLPGIFESGLQYEARELLQIGSASLRSFINAVGCGAAEYSGDMRPVRGCNTPEEYAEMMKLLMQK